MTYLRPSPGRNIDGHDPLRCVPIAGHQTAGSSPSCAPVYDDLAAAEVSGRRGDDGPTSGSRIEFSGDANQFAVLVDNREGDHKGAIVQHPLFDKLFAEQQAKLPGEQPKLPDRFKNYRVSADRLARRR